MLTEGIVLREIARRSATSANRADLQKSKEVLERARDILRDRPPSPARTHQLSSVLTALAGTVGSTMHSALEASPVPGPDCLALAREARATAQESQSYQENYRAIDVAFWANRDLYRALKGAGTVGRGHGYDTAVQDTLDGMADALDRAAELGEMDKIEQDYLSARLVEFETIVGDVNIARSMADRGAKEGKFSAACWIARQMAIDPRQNVPRSPADCEYALKYLERFLPSILTSERAAALMQRLWLGARLGDYRLDERRHRIACREEEWRRFDADFDRFLGLRWVNSCAA
jgi:hypothetical protein